MWKNKENDKPEYQSLDWALEQNQRWQRRINISKLCVLKIVSIEVFRVCLLVPVNGKFLI